MMAFRSFGRALLSALAILIAGGVMVSSAMGSLTLDLQLPGGGTVIQVVDPSAPLTVSLELWATVTGADGITTNDGLWKFYTSIRSSNGGLMLGNMSKTGKSGWFAGTAFSLGLGATIGTQKDLDGDGDMDIGSNDDADATSGWMLARASAMQASVAFERTPPYNSWGIAKYTFTKTGMGDPHGVTKLYLTPRPGIDNLWNEDGYIWEGEDAYPPYLPEDWLPDSDRLGTPLAGKFVTLYVAADAVVPPAIVANMGDMLVLDAGASLGSINTYQWDLDGDMGWDLTVHNPLVAIPWDDLINVYGLVPGQNYDARLRVAWEESPALTWDEQGFQLNVMPEPATLALLGFGLVSLLARRKR